MIGLSLSNDSLSKWNDEMLAEYEPEKLLLEPPKDTIFSKATKESIKKEKKSTGTGYSSSYKDSKRTESRRSDSGYYGSSYGGGRTSGYSSKAPHEKAKEQFESIKKKAYSEADDEMREYTETCHYSPRKYKRNPHLSYIRNPRLYFWRAKRLPGGGARKLLKKGALVAGIAITQVAVITIREAQENLKERK